jgi:hypothetical protein
MKSVGSHCSWSLIFMVKAMVWYFVSKVMIALILVVLVLVLLDPTLHRYLQSVLLEFSMQSHRCAWFYSLDFAISLWWVVIHARSSFEEWICICIEILCCYFTIVHWKASLMKVDSFGEHIHVCRFFIMAVCTCQRNISSPGNWTCAVQSIHSHGQ